MPLQNIKNILNGSSICRVCSAMALTTNHGQKGKRLLHETRALRFFELHIAQPYFYALCNPFNPTKHPMWVWYMANCIYYQYFMFICTIVV